MRRLWPRSHHTFVRLLTAALLCAMSPLAAFPAERAREKWTTSRVTGSPDPPPPYRIVRAFPQLKFKGPLLLARCPGSDRLFIGEQDGAIYSFGHHPDATPDLLIDLRKELKTLHQHPGAKDFESLYGLAFHPDFEQNRQCFVCYTLSAKNPRERNLADGTRVSRFSVTRTDPPRIDPASEEVVFAFPQGGHNGGDIHFGPDGMLYISTGDGSSPNPPDALDTGQDVADLLSSILRIDVNRTDAGRKYAVPPDNPFVDLPGARPEIWAYGFRNPWRMSFDRKTGDLLVGDVGWELWEMIHRVERGGNYGWAATEGPQPIKAEQVGPTPIHPALIELPHTIACSITGGYVYRGRKFPELQGAYVFGDWETRRIWAARFEDNTVKEMPEIARPSVRFSAFGEDNDGELYFLDHDQGTIHTLEHYVASSQNTAFPLALSETGLFASVKDHQLAPGVVPFTVNGRQWLDGATAEHFVALPGDSAVLYHESGKPVAGLVYWHNFRMHFPESAVLARTLSLEGQRLETQLLHFEGGDWRAYTYVWRDDQSDADLAPADGAEKVLNSGGQRRVWQVHSRSQCMSCHSNQSEYALAFLPEQLNRPSPDGSNQLIALTESGIIRRVASDGKPLPPFDDASVRRERAVADPADERQPVEARARGYLHANCGHCHSDHGGGAVPLRLQFQVPTAEMHAIGVRPTRGDLGLPEAAIIEPGDPYASTLFFRMAKFGRDRMPHIGSEQPDEAGLRLIEQWIAGLQGRAERAAANPNGSEPAALLVDPKSATLAARRLGRGELTPETKESLLAAAAKLPPGNIRDLFEGYLPPDPRGQRKLGSSPAPQKILVQQGDASRGEKLFWSETVNCGKCHRLGERGTAVGPELSTIGQTRSRADLLESLLSPSRRIEPKYAVYVVRTEDGRSLTGVLVQRDEKAVVLRDNQGQAIVLEASNVQTLQPSRLSLMPEGQMAGLTAQEAADLLAYLAACKGERTIRSP